MIAIERTNLKVSVVIPTCNRAGSLALTLRSIAAQNVDLGIFEVLVVDNGSIDSTPSIVEAASLADPHLSIRYICEPVPGLLSGRHRGALNAQGELLIFIDDDITADPGWLAAIIESFRDPTVQLVGGRSLPLFEIPPPEWLGAFWSTTPYGGRSCCHLSLLDLGESSLDIDAKCIWGLNFAIRRTALFELGGFHPDCIPDHLQRFQGDGETGLTHEANARDYRAVYQPKAVVFHRVPALRMTAKYFERRAFYQGVCDSYTKIRRDGGVLVMCDESDSNSRIESPMQRLSRYARRPMYHARNLLRRSFLRAPVSQVANTDDPVVVDIKQRLREGYRAGYNFHHSAVKQSPKLLQWVLRKDYWDYRLHIDAMDGEVQESSSREWTPTSGAGTPNSPDEMFNLRQAAP